MNISFRNSDDGLASEIFLDSKPLGVVVMDIWTKKWKVRPSFKHDSYTSHSALHSRYDSSYQAGKALVRLYEDMFFVQDDSLEDTQEIDMRDIWKSFKRGP